MFLLRIQVMSHQIPLPHLPDLQLLILYFPLSFLEIILTIRIINDAAFLCRIYRCSIARNSSLRPSFLLPPSNPSCSSSLTGRQVGSFEVCPPNNLSAQQQRHRHLPFPLFPPAFPMVLSRAPREMKMSKGVVSFFVSATFQKSFSLSKRCRLENFGRY